MNKTPQANRARTINCRAVILQLTDRVRRTSAVAPVASAVAAEAPAVDASVSIAVGVLEAVAVAVGEVAVGVGEPVALRNTHDAQAPVLIWRRREGRESADAPV